MIMAKGDVFVAFKPPRIEGLFIEFCMVERLQIMDASMHHQDVALRACVQCGRERFGGVVLGDCVNGFP